MKRMYLVAIMLAMLVSACEATDGVVMDADDIHKDVSTLTAELTPVTSIAADASFKYIELTLEPEPEVDEAEVEMLACLIYQEAGGNACSDTCRAYIGDVALNRVLDPRFPDTLEGVLTQKRQYGRFYWTGIVWPARASKPEETAAVERAYDTARALLSGEHSELYGAGYIWQAEFKQGVDIIYLDGLYFGR